MNRKTGKVSCFLLIAINYGTALAVVQNTYQIPDLLGPQLDLQINLRIPDKHYSRFPKLSPALIHAMDFLTSKQAPFRLFYNISKVIPSALMIRPSRYAQNQVLFLVFLTVRSKSHRLSVGQVYTSCSLKTLFGMSLAMHKNFIQIVVDESAVAES